MRPEDMIDNAGNYFGLWALDDHTADGMRALYSEVDAADYMANRDMMIALAEDSASDEYDVDDGVAVIRVEGAMMKRASSLFGGASTIGARRKLRAALRDEQVQGVAFVISSGGGTVDGTDDLAQAVAQADKPVYAYIEDIGASAAYWVAAGADKVYANRTAKIGNVGTMLVVQDVSKRAERAGVKVHVVKSTELKGLGTPGTELSESQIAELQRVIDATNARFLSHVSNARGLTPEQTQEIATARVYVGTDAMDVGLIDGVKSYEDTLRELKTEFTPTASAAGETTDPMEEPMELSSITLEQLAEANQELVNQIGQSAAASAVENERERAASIARLANKYRCHTLTSTAIAGGLSADDAENEIRAAASDALAATASDALPESDPDTPENTDPLAALTGTELYEAEWEADKGGCQAEFFFDRDLYVKARERGDA